MFCASCGRFDRRYGIKERIQPKPSRAQTLGATARDKLSRVKVPNVPRSRFNTSPTSSVMWPFDTPYAISYRCSVVTCNQGCISSRFRDNGPRKFWGSRPWPFKVNLDLSRYLDVIDYQMTNRFAVDYFLLVVYCNQVSISKRFRDIRPQKPVHRHTQKHAHRHTPQVILYSVPCNVLHWTDNNKQYYSLFCIFVCHTQCLNYSKTARGSNAIGSRIEARVALWGDPLWGDSVPLLFYIFDLLKVYFCRLLSTKIYLSSFIIKICQNTHTHGMHGGLQWTCDNKKQTNYCQWWARGVSATPKGIEIYRS